jgi:hypothetical protein
LSRSDPARTGNANSALLAQSRRPGRDIHGIAEKVVALHHDVADVHPDPKSHLLIGRSIQIRLRYGFLHVNSTLHRVNGTGEIGDETAASRVKDPTTIRGDQGIDDGPIRGEGTKGADLILPHQAAVALDIGENATAQAWPRGFRDLSLQALRARRAEALD